MGEHIMTYYVPNKHKELHEAYIAKLDEMDLSRSKHIMKFIKGFMKRTDASNKGKK